MSEMQSVRIPGLQEYEFSPLAAQIIGRAVQLDPRSPWRLKTEDLLLSFLEIGPQQEVSKKTPGFVARLVSGEGLDYLNRELEKARGDVSGTKGIEEPSAVENITDYADSVLQLAERIATVTSKTSRVSARHLFAALVTLVPGKRSIVAHDRLREAGLTLEGVRVKFLAFVVRTCFLDDKAGWRNILTPIVRQNLISGFSPDDASGAQEDKLDITPDVNAFASLIASTEINPPLSVGLFGEWGSGKTFFMEKVHDRVAWLSEQARISGHGQHECAYFHHIVQVRFNAWRYMGGHLWASLVQHIFESLSAREEDAGQRRDYWLLQVSEAGKRKTEAEEVRNRLLNAQKAAEGRLGQLLEEQVQTRELRVGDVTKALWKWFNTPGETQGKLKTHLVGLGIQELMESKEELYKAHDQLAGVIGDAKLVLRRITTLLRKPDRTLLYFALAVIGVAVVIVLVPVILERLGPDWLPFLQTAIATWVTRGVLFFGGSLAWFGQRLCAVHSVLKPLREAAKKFDADVDEKRAERENAVKAKVEVARQEGAELGERVSAANDMVTAADRDLKEKQKQLQDQEPPRRLAKFIEDRADSSDYLKHLGIMSLIHSDFAQLSRLISEQNDQLLHPEQQTEMFVPEEVRVNRIVLYIDDLDRCQPDKVVEVLQAVHLLLALPLFVVVVGVDARWMYNSLSGEYQNLLTGSGGERKQVRDGDGSAGLLYSATPWDYLGKIFQIPFWIGAMGAPACGALIEHLAKGAASKPATDAGTGDEGGKEPERTVAGGEPDRGVGPAPEKEPAPRVTPTATGTGPASVGTGAGIVFDPNPPSLDISQHELDFLKGMAPIVSESPRTVKRFVNLYRLVKAGHPWPDVEHAAGWDFVGDNGKSPEYRAAIILLAVAVAKPELCAAFFKEVEDSSGPTPLEDYLKGLDAASFCQAGTAKDERRSEAHALTKALKSLAGNEEQGRTPAVNLDGVAMDRLRCWSPRVNRYSFGRGPQPRTDSTPSPGTGQEKGD